MLTLPHFFHREECRDPSLVIVNTFDSPSVNSKGRSGQAPQSQVNEIAALHYHFARNDNNETLASNLKFHYSHYLRIHLIYAIALFRCHQNVTISKYVKLHE